MAVPVEALEPYLRAMLAENERVNLTAIRDVEAARVLHCVDSLAIQDLRLAAPRTCLDIGTGNGFPGVALRFVFPEAAVTLLDRTRKKLLAIERAMAVAGVEGVATRHADAVQLPRTDPELAGAFDLVTARAVAAPDKVADLAGGLTARDGRLVLWLDVQTAAPGGLRGFAKEREWEYELPEPAARQRRLAVYRRG